jgi:hypothetical protein
MMRETSLTLGFEPRTVQPVASHCTHSTIPTADLKLKGSKSNIIHLNPLLAWHDNGLIKIFCRRCGMYYSPTTLRVFFELESIAPSLRVELQTVRGAK